MGKPNRIYAGLVVQTSNASSSWRADWLLPIGLFALTLVPMLAGASRLLQLTGTGTTPENARFLAAPFPVTIHVFASVIYCILGAVQFSEGLRRRNPTWHRASGRILVAVGLASALSGLWMTQFYPRADFDGPAVYAMRLLAGSAMVVSLCLGVVAIQGGDVQHHQAWMKRAYALGMGAGTQVLTHLPWLLFPDIRGEALRAACMGAGWAINLLIAEWSIRQFSKARKTPCL